MIAINNPDDGTPAKGFFKLGEELLLIITEKCTYRLQVADQIDPDRTNPALPLHFQQKLFDHGTNSDLLCRTLLHAKVLFRKEFQAIDVEQAKQLSFDAFSDLVAMQGAAEAFQLAEQAEIRRVKALDQNDGSQALPAVGNVRGHCKSFMQKADHCGGSLLSIVSLFYSEMKNKGWEQFHELVESRYGKDDNFFKVSEITNPTLLLVRNARNCLEHPANAARVKTEDFKPQPDGTIASPSIAVDFRGSHQDLCPVSWFMSQVTTALVDAFEMITVHMCSKSMQSFAGFPMIIQPIPEKYKAGWHARFAYGMYNQNGEFAPCG
jgi:hypothetical protein